MFCLCYHAMLSYGILWFAHALQPGQPGSSSRPQDPGASTRGAAALLQWAQHGTSGGDPHVGVEGFGGEARVEEWEYQVFVNVFIWM